MQACPYDALYIDPNTNTAAKCNFCAHRVENKLEPACVIVCPTQAILAGDLDDAKSNVSHVVATQKVTVRKPQKGTEPKLFYKGIEGDLLEPTRLSRQNTYAFAQQHDKRSAAQKFNPGVTREIYDVAHPAPWGWKIATYLWTKSIAAGALLAAALYMPAGLPQSLSDMASPLVALIALAATMALLVFDLKRPDRFFYLLTKPNFRSWLVLGAYVLTAYGASALAWLLLTVSAQPVPVLLRIVTVMLALAAAGYSAFLFAQAKGRELWQSTLFFFHLLVQAYLAGTATFILISFALPPNGREDPNLYQDVTSLLFFCLALSVLMILAEVALPHRNADVKVAVHSLVRGRYRTEFWGIAIGLGLLCPMLLAMPLVFLDQLNDRLVIAVPILALAGLWWWERLWVKAGQVVPLS
jgi:formate-dependent nitrite reductase membrane component NrfD